MNEETSGRRLEQSASAEDALSPQIESAPEYVGHVDGVDDDGAFGWAWRPTAPDERVTIEQWVGGVLVQTMTADIFRNDLDSAGIGDGAHGWRMPLVLNPEIAEPQNVEIRVKDGPVLQDGVLSLTYVAPIHVEPPPVIPPRRIKGRCDGVDRGDLIGWAWKPGHAAVIVEQWVDGDLKVRSRADLPRNDLIEAGVGIGAHGFRIPLMLDPNKAGAQRVEVRVEDEILEEGALELVYAPPADASVPADGKKRSTVAGYVDRIEAGEAFGWAWRPAFPEHHVEVEQWVNGKRVGKVLADLTRADLHEAKVGHGHYGWRMPLMLDPGIAETQIVEFRAGDGVVFENGRLELTFEQREASAPQERAAEPASMTSGVFGCYDGLKGSTLHGWARNIDAPDDPVDVELWVDGERVAEAVANGFRPDLRASGVGHGRYGWRLPIVIDPERRTPMHVEIKAKGGGEIVDGVFDLRIDLSIDDPANAELRPFIDAVFGSGPPLRGEEAPEQPPTTFILFTPPRREAGPLWAREYDDYATISAMFAPVFAKLGRVIETSDAAQAAAMYGAHTESGDNCLLISFATPREAPLEIEGAIVPAFGWAFPDIPAGVYDEDPRSDWRHVLRQTGRAIVFSHFAEAAVRAAMGESFPVEAVAPPVADRDASLPAPNLARRTIEIDGVVFDSRAYTFNPNEPGFPTCVWPANQGARSVIDVDGVVYAAVCDVSDGRYNWKDLISSFVITNAARPDATLVIKLSEPASDWWRQIHRALVVLPKFQCRVVAVRGEASDVDYRSFMAASHFFVSLAKADGVALDCARFMSAGRPVIAPSHSALTDYIDPSNAFVVASDEEPWSWPDKAEDEGWSWTQAPDDVGPTIRQRISWVGLSAAFTEAYNVAKADLARYARLSAAASEKAKAVCGDDVVAAKLDVFLGLDRGLGPRPATPAVLGLGAALG